MLFEDISILDEFYEIRHNMFVGTKGSKITYISEDEPEDSKAFGTIYNGTNKLLIPGFYNSHAHSPMSLLRGYGEGLQLQEWLHEKIFPFESKINAEDVYWGTLLSMAESMRFGIVSSTDMYFLTDGLVRAVIDSGMKGNICRSVSNFGLLPSVDDPTYNEMVYTVEKYQGAANGRIIIDASLHAEYTNDDRTARAVAEYAKEKNVRMHVHVSETEREVKECKDRHGGLSPVKYFSKMGVFDVPTTAAHCVWIDDEDRRILKEKGVTVASNPISNLKLASGICDVGKLYDAGIPVAIGTDGVASNNSLNYFEEIKTFALLGKYRSMDPSRMNPKEILMSATRVGAEAQGRLNSGVLKTGCAADLAVVDINAPNMNPGHDLANNLVYSASGNDVCLTMVDGVVLYQDGEYKTVDIERVEYEVNTRCAFNTR